MLTESKTDCCSHEPYEVVENEIQLPYYYSKDNIEFIAVELTVTRTEVSINFKDQ